jgi:hypothetical protein
MTEKEIDKLNDLVRAMRIDINEVRRGAVELRDGYAEALCQVASECLMKLQLQAPKRRP